MLYMLYNIYIPKVPSHNGLGKVHRDHGFGYLGCYIMNIYIHTYIYHIHPLYKPNVWASPPSRVPASISTKTQSTIDLVSQLKHIRHCGGVSNQISMD